MPNLTWSHLSGMQLGRCAESFCRLEFMSYGFSVYTPELDDHGVDFVAKRNGEFYEVQVKSVRQDNYLYIRKDKLSISERFLICYLRFVDGKLPDVFIFPATVWKNPNALFVDRPYDKPGQKSAPEVGICYNQKNAVWMEPHRADKFFKKF